MDTNDVLQVASNSDYSKIIHFDQEPVLFSSVVKKVNTWSIKQDRVLILTYKYLYNFKKKQLKRKIDLKDIAAVIKNSKNSNEFTIHVPSEYDYRYMTDKREDFLNLLKLAHS